MAGTSIEICTYNWGPGSENTSLRHFQSHCVAESLYEDALTKESVSLASIVLSIGAPQMYFCCAVNISSQWIRGQESRYQLNWSTSQPQPHVFVNRYHSLCSTPTTRSIHSKPLQHPQCRTASLSKTKVIRLRTGIPVYVTIPPPNSIASCREPRWPPNQPHMTRTMPPAYFPRPPWPEKIFRFQPNDFLISPLLSTESFQPSSAGSSPSKKCTRYAVVIGAKQGLSIVFSSAYAFGP